MAVRKKKTQRREWSVSEKLEVVQVRQRGLTLPELQALYHVGTGTVYKWVDAYEANGLVGLEQTGNRAIRRQRPRWAQAVRKARSTGTGS